MQLRKIIINGKEYYEPVEDTVVEENKEQEIDSNNNNIDSDAINEYTQKINNILELYIAKVDDAFPSFKEELKKIAEDFKENISTMGDKDDIVEEYNDTLDEFDAVLDDYEEDYDEYIEETERKRKLQSTIILYSNRIDRKLDLYSSKISNEYPDYKIRMQSKVTSFKASLSKIEDEDDVEDAYKDCIDDLDDILDTYEDEVNHQNTKKHHEKTRDYFSFHNIFNRQKKNSNKANKLVSIIPFMSEEEIHQVVEQLINDEESLKDFPLISIMPFVSKNDADLIFEKALNDDSVNINPVEIAPFVSQKALSIVVDKYINGKITDINIDALYPFLSSDDIKRLFKFIVSKN